jgi:hypothetical protein
MTALDRAGSVGVRGSSPLSSTRVGRVRNWALTCPFGVLPMSPASTLEHGEAVRYVVAQPTDVDVNEIVVRPTKAHAELYSAGLESRLRPLGLLLLRSTHHPPGKQTSLAIGGRRWRSHGEERHVVGGMVADHCVNELVAQRGDV